VLATLYNKTTGKLVASVKITEPEELQAHLASGQVGAILGGYDLSLLELDLPSMTLKRTAQGEEVGIDIPGSQIVFLGTTPPSAST
jgi:hypothetical protein